MSGLALTFRTSGFAAEACGLQSLKRLISRWFLGTCWIVQGLRGPGVREFCKNWVPATLCPRSLCLITEHHQQPSDHLCKLQSSWADQMWSHQMEYPQVYK